MSRNLKLLPVHERSWVSFSVLEVDPSPVLFDALEELKGLPVPEEFESYVGCVGDEEEQGFGPTTSPFEGGSLLWVRAHLLCKFAQHEEVVDDATNRAAWAYLAALPPDTRIVLYWE
ncbi:MAG: hypothetical protein ACHREM_04800 [Polyangiales bacterium]